MVVGIIRSRATRSASWWSPSARGIGVGRVGERQEHVAGHVRERAPALDLGPRVVDDHDRQPVLVDGGCREEGGQIDRAHGDARVTRRSRRWARAARYSRRQRALPRRPSDSTVQSAVPQRSPVSRRGVATVHRRCHVYRRTASWRTAISEPRIHNPCDQCHNRAVGELVRAHGETPIDGGADEPREGGDGEREPGVPACRGGPAAARHRCRRRAPLPRRRPRSPPRRSPRFTARANAVVGVQGPLRYHRELRGLRDRRLRDRGGQQPGRRARRSHSTRFRSASSLIAPGLTEPEAAAFVAVANAEPAAVRARGGAAQLARWRRTSRTSPSSRSRFAPPRRRGFSAST